MTLIKNSGEFRRGKHDARVQGRRVALRNSVAGAAASGREADIKPPFPISKDTPENRPFAYRQVGRLLSQFDFSARTRRLSRALDTRRPAWRRWAYCAAAGVCIFECAFRSWRKPRMMQSSKSGDAPARLAQQDHRRQSRPARAAAGRNRWLLLKPLAP